MRPFINQNWVANFVNLIYFGPPTFSLVISVLYHQFGQSSRLSSCICFLVFLKKNCIIFIKSKVGNNMSLFCNVYETRKENTRKKSTSVFFFNHVSIQRQEGKAIILDLCQKTISLS